MSREKNFLTWYVLCSKLTDEIRTGWKNWNVTRKRIESVAEHVFKVLMTAIGMHSEFQYDDVDLQKVLFMLAVHELEEIIIGDLTPFQISKEEKERIGHDAVHRILKNLMEGKQIEQLILEFDARKTKEAKFAYMCDKLDCDLQSKDYDQQGCVNLNEQADNETFANERVQELLAEGNTWSDMWMKYDLEKIPYDDNFRSVIKYAIENGIPRREDIEGD